MYKLNKSIEIRETIKPILSECDELYIAIAYMTESGFNELLNLEDIQSKRINIITTFEQGITEPSLLRKLINKAESVNIFDPSEGHKSFHSKFIVGLRKGEIKINMVGSMNLTKPALTSKFETIEYSLSSHDYTLLKDFEFLKSSSSSLNEEILVKYEEVYNRRKILEPEFNFLDKKINIAPRGMQNGVLSELKEIRGNGHSSALLYASTGTGKTYLSAFDLKSFKFRKALFIVHNRLIIRSAKRDYSTVFLDKKILELHSWNKRLVSNSDVVFSTQQTIITAIEKNPDFLEQFDYFVFDEAHRIGAETQQYTLFKKIEELKKGKFILGMTATPWRGDDPSFLFKIFKNRIVGRIDLERALNENLVCDFKYKAIGASDINFDVDRLDRSNMEILLSKFMNAVDESKTWDGTKVKGIIFTSNTYEANELSQMINDKYSKYKAMPFHSKINKINEDVEVEHDYEVLIKLLEDDNDKLNFIVTVDKFNEGVDIPRINTIGMFRFTKSNIIYSQQIGRGLRLESKDKYLNIIDLVGNQKASEQRVFGITGKRTLSPTKAVRNALSTEFEIDDVARKEIIKKICKNVKYEKYFKDKLYELNVMQNIKPKPSELEEYLGENIGIIINNFRDSREYSFEKSNPWIINYKKEVGLNYVTLTSEEMGLLELFSWLPLTVSTPNEKRKILDLMDGKVVLLDNRWKEYFYGKRNEWSLVKGDYDEYFAEVEEGFVFKIDNDFSIDFRGLFIEIKELLTSKIDSDDYMQSKWYIRPEVNFMAGKVRRSQDATLRKDANNIFITNIMDKRKNKTTYENKVISNNEYIISSNNRQKYDKPENENYHNFMGRSTFHKHTMFLYVGFQESINERITSSEFPTYDFISKIMISDDDYLMLVVGN